MLRRGVVVRTDVSEEPSASTVIVKRIGDLGTLAVASNRRRLGSWLVEPARDEEARPVVDVCGNIFPWWH
jgi:hypothetical protein